MKSANRMSHEEMTATQGIAQRHGFANREAYRKAIYKDSRKTRNTSLKAIGNFIIGGRIFNPPIPPAYPRKKLKGWQKNLKCH